MCPRHGLRSEPSPCFPPTSDRTALNRSRLHRIKGGIEQAMPHRRNVVLDERRRSRYVDERDIDGIGAATSVDQRDAPNEEIRTVLRPSDLKDHLGG